MTTTRSYRWAIAALALGAISCGDNTEPASVAPAIKVKNLLTGLHASDEEAQLVAADPAALRGLIDAWMETSEFRGKLLDFFKQAFQQTQINFMQFEDQIGDMPTLTQELKARLVQSAELSFPLTALQLIDEGRPFTEALTTDRFVLNPPLMMLLAYIDNVVVDDLGATSTWLATRFGSRFAFTLHRDDTVHVPLEESLDPASPHFLHFYEPCPLEDGVPACGVVSITSPFRVNQLIFGHLLAKQITAGDWSDWRMIRVRSPSAGEDPDMHFSLPAFRSTAPEHQVMSLEAARVGFMTTPAFFANWPTNASNLARVTVNQALIVGVGYSLADSGAIVPVTETGNPDGAHSQPGTPCFACHQTLDPMRNFFRQSYSVSYHHQTRLLDLPPEQQQAKFILDGVAVEGTGVRDFALAMAQHPRFASAWTQKLCHYATSSACDEDDPEFIRVTDVFRASNYDFKSLVRELFSSPLVTGVAVAVTIARRDHFCAALQNRLGLPDVCKLAASQPELLQNLSFGIPGAGYARGAASPLLPRDPDLFATSSVEGLCGNVAQQVVDPAACAPGQRCFSSADIPRAIDDLVRVVMALPAIDARFSDVRQILSEHYDDAAREGASAADALASTFVLACTSPLSNTIGL